MFFVYETKNLINGKIYIGVHVGKIDDSYLGSGTYLSAAILKYGRENFTRKILYVTESIDEAYELEKTIVTEDFVKLNSNYNLKPGGKGGWFSAIKFGDENVMRRPDVAAKVSASLKRSITEEERRVRSDRMKKLRNNGTIIKPTGWAHSESAKEKISKGLTGKTAWNKGKTMPKESELTRKKKSESAKIRAQKQDMGALTRGKSRSPKVSCIKCRKTMYVHQFENFHGNGKCWK
jgi:hypothetical protein